MTAKLTAPDIHAARILTAARAIADYILAIPLPTRTIEQLSYDEKLQVSRALIALVTARKEELRCASPSSPIH
jgi:hypothetical protein